MSGDRNPDYTAARLARATWLVELVVKRMTLQPDGTAHLVLTPGMVGVLQDYIADEEVGS